MKTEYDYWKESHDRVLEEIKNKKPWIWEPWYAWYPKRINGRWYWREYVYRYWCLAPGSGFWRYGDEFSLLRDE